MHGSPFLKSIPTSPLDFYSRTAIEEPNTAYRALLDSPAGLINVQYRMALSGRSGTPGEAIAAMERVTREGIQRMAQNVRLDTVYFLAPGAADQTV